MILDKYWHYQCPNCKENSVIYAATEADFAEYREGCTCKEATITPAIHSQNPHILINALEGEIENQNRSGHNPSLIFKKIVTSPEVPADNRVWLAIARAIVKAYEEIM